MLTNKAFSRRRFLQTSAMLTAGGVLQPVLPNVPGCPTRRR